MDYNYRSQLFQPLQPVLSLMCKTTILIADDHQLLRDTWTFILNSDPRFHVVGVAASGEESVMLTEQVNPQVVLMDINMGSMSGFEATQTIKRQSPRTKVIGVSMHSMPAYARKLFKMGASGYVTKNSSREELLNAIENVQAGNTYICEEIREIMYRQEQQPDAERPDINILSSRELEIAEFIKQGLSSREIAKRLEVSIKTIEVHRYNIFKKLRLPNIASLINFLSHHGL